MAVSLTVFEIFSVKVLRDLENWVRGCSRSSKMASFHTAYTTFYWSAIVNIALFVPFFELFDVEWYHDLEIWVKGHSRSFKPVPFESLGVVSYSSSMVAMAVSCIICEMKRDLVENRDFFIPPLHSRPLFVSSNILLNHSRSFEMTRWVRRV